MCPPKPLRYKGCRIQTAHSNVPFSFSISVFQIVVVYVQGASPRKNMYAIEHAELVARNAGVFHQVPMATSPDTTEYRVRTGLERLEAEDDRNQI
ncbi:hypothetical protein D5086_024857 [Populus alba]|uniref:Uncharacterized protein n=1 Tax=Populus alba TaxID=43335 RepID=A0ACC4B6P0_POPAL